jgi:hypothetical protein
MHLWCASCQEQVRPAINQEVDCLLNTSGVIFHAEKTHGDLMLYVTVHLILWFIAGQSCALPQVICLLQ